MVRSAAQLIARDGLQATGMRDVAQQAGAPRGSIQHHFPGGKDQLTHEALTWIGGAVRAELDAAAERRSDPGSDSRSPHSQLVLTRFASLWRDGLIQTQFASGCSIAAVVHDSDDPELLDSAAAVFRGWREPFERALIADGAPAACAGAVATTMIAALEGAVILSRAERDSTPLDQTVAILRGVIDRAVDNDANAVNTAAGRGGPAGRPAGTG